MRIEQFFDIILPQNGYRCLALPNKKLPGFRHQVFESNAAAAKRAYWLDFSKNEEVYFACGSLKEPFVMGTNARGREKKMYRIRENIAFLRSLWFDIDCGEDKDYLTQKDAAIALHKFLQETGLPTPLVVSSGKGLHVYWPMTQDLPVNYWDRLANILHELGVAYGLRVDPKRTRDASSVLRPAGTRHKKDPENMLDVAVKNEGKFVISTPKQLVDTLVVAAKKKGISGKNSHTPSVPGTNANSALTSGMYENVKSTAPKIAENCAAIRLMRDTRGLIKEPLWYDAIGVLRHTKESPNVIHEWSNRHPGYHPDETAAKIEQHVAHGAGPTTCAHIHDYTEARALCEACPHYGNIKSPIVLGREEPAPPSPDTATAELPGQADASAPKTFVRLPTSVKTVMELEDNKMFLIGAYELKASGVYFKGFGEQESETAVRIFPFPVILTSIARDHQHRTTRLMVEHLHPLKGISHFDIEAKIFAEKAAFHKKFLDEGISIALNAVDMMRDYLNTYMDELGKEVDSQQLYIDMGWKEGHEAFLLGDRLLRKGAPTEKHSFGAYTSNALSDYVRPVGDLKTWSSISNILNKEGMEAHAMTLLFGFGAPIMKMTGFDGTYINMLGKSNAGKTTMLTWIASIYGEYSHLKTQKGDTYNSKMSRLAALNNLPMVLDEVTNMNDDDVSDFIYDVTQGRDKARLRKDATAMEARTWSTLVISSSNSSISDKLQGSKGDAEAERMRMIEYVVPNLDVFETHAKEIHAVLKDNYGVAAEPYLKYIVDNYDKIQDVLTKYIATFETLARSEGRERFWVAALSAALVGGYIAKNLGIIDINIERVRNWAVKMVRDMRDDVKANAANYSGFLGEFMNSNIINTLKLDMVPRNNTFVISSWVAPKRDLLIRVEKYAEESRVFISKVALNRWIRDKKIDRATFLNELYEKGYLAEKGVAKILGEGWPDNTSNSAVACIELCLDNSECGKIGLHENVSLTKLNR